MTTDILPHPRAAAGDAAPHVRLAGPAELAGLADRWNDLTADLGPIEQFDWADAARQTVALGQRPLVLSVEQDESLTALAALATQRRRGIVRLVQLGVGELFEPMDLVARDADSLDALAAALARLGRPLWLDRLPADSPAIPAIERALRGRALVLRRAAANCPYILLDESWQEPQDHLNAGRRSDLRRARRKAEQQGAVTSEILVPRADEVDRLIDEAIEIESRSWKGESGTALAHDPQRAAFYRRHAQAAAAAGVLRMCFLRIGGKGVAMQLAIEQGHGFWLLKVGYDSEYSPCSPGLLLMRDTIAYSARAGLARYEFLGRAESWTRVWTERERETVGLRVYPYGPRGLAALVLDAGAAALARWRKK